MSAALEYNPGSNGEVDPLGSSRAVRASGGCHLAAVSGETETPPETGLQAVPERVRLARLALLSASGDTGQFPKVMDMLRPYPGRIQ